jgi:hypothetical protein
VELPLRVDEAVLEAVLVPEAVGETVGVGEGVAAAVALPDSEALPVAEGDTPSVSVGEGEADTVLLLLLVVLGVSEAVREGVGVEVPVGVCVGVCVGVGVLLAVLLLLPEAEVEELVLREASALLEKEGEKVDNAEAVALPLPPPRRPRGEALAGCEVDGSTLALPEPEELGQGSGEAAGLREKEGEALLLGLTE